MALYKSLLTHLYASKTKFHFSTFMRGCLVINNRNTALSVASIGRRECCAATLHSVRCPTSDADRLRLMLRKRSVCDKRSALRSLCSHPACYGGCWLGSSSWNDKVDLKHCAVLRRAVP